MKLGAFRRWDLAQKAKNPFAGLAFFRRTNSPGTINIASRHWPHLLCWQWYLSFGPTRSLAPRWHISWMALGQQLVIQLGRWELIYSRQSYDYMPNVGVPDREFLQVAGRLEKQALREARQQFNREYGL